MSKQTTLTGTVPVGEALLGRAIDAAGQPIDGGPPLTDVARLPIERAAELAASRQPGQPLETGIKVIDLYAPIARGGTVPLIAMPGTGMIVVSTELIHNIATRRGGCAVLADLGDHTFSTNDLIAELRGGGVERYATLIAGQQADPPALKRQIALMALTLAEHYCQQGRETLLFMDERLVSQDTVARLRDHRRGGQAALTLLVWHVRSPETFDPDAITRQSPLDLDGRLVFSRALAKQSVWPALDPLASESPLLNEQGVGGEHARVAGAARQLLREHGLESIAAPGGDLAQAGRARRVLLFQGQPFVVAETFTGKPGEYVSMAETVSGYGAIVDGKHDEVPEEAFRFTGTLGQVLARATA